jgi:glycosyltransferase involved in cell wall biosynthesis
VKVIFVGIHEDEELRKIRSEFKLPHQVYYEGEVDSKMALNYYRLFTSTVLCSVSEGLSQGLLESMYLGIPIIATAAAGNIDLIQHKSNGLLFPDENIEALANCIKMIHSDPNLYKKLVSGGITTAADTFSIDRTVRTYEEFYLSLLSSRKIHIHA